MQHHPLQFCVQAFVIVRRCGNCRRPFCMSDPLYAVARSASRSFSSAAAVDQSTEFDLFRQIQPRQVSHKKWLARSRAAHNKSAAARDEKLASRVETVNEAAVREGDVIQPRGQKKGKPGGGKGNHKRWTARAMALAAFGRARKHCMPKSLPSNKPRKRSKLSRRRHAAAVAPSARTTADNFESGHSHVQKVRDTIANSLLRGQAACISSEILAI